MFKLGETQAQRSAGNPDIDLLLKKIQELEVENVTNKSRLEALEIWSLKITESVEKIEPGNDAFNRELRSEREQSIKCKLCKETFFKNCELENHMVTIHDSEKTYGCETCGKTFVLKWRLKKHLIIHQESVKSCKFFKEGKECPFDDIGCKFDHNDKETNAVKAVTMRSRDKTTTVKVTVPTVEVINILDSTKSNVEKVAEERVNEDAIQMLEEGGDKTGNDANSEKCLESRTSSIPLEKSQAFFDLDNPHVYPPIVYPQNTHAVYPQNPPILYPQNTHTVYHQNPPIVYPQNHQTRAAGTSSLPSIDELFPPQPHYVPPRSNQGACWNY